MRLIIQVNQVELDSYTFSCSQNRESLSLQQAGSVFRCYLVHSVHVGIPLTEFPRKGTGNSLDISNLQIVQLIIRQFNILVSSFKMFKIYSLCSTAWKFGEQW